MGAADRELVKRHIDVLLKEAGEQKVPLDLIGRLLMDVAIGVWRQSGREIDDIAAELEYKAGNLDPNAEFPFMRP